MLTFITESCFYSQVWHLVRHDSDSQKDSERSNKLVSEIYLTRFFSLTQLFTHILSGFSQTFPRLKDKGRVSSAMNCWLPILSDSAPSHLCTTLQLAPYQWQSI